MFQKTKRILFVLILASILLISFYFFSSHSAQNYTHDADVTKAKIAEESQVIRVVDGDTIIVAVNHKPETIRLIGINTPETVAPNKPVQCYGPEASKRTKELLTDKIVRLESDPSQDDKDKYHRLLRYVFLGDKNVNEELVRDGFAREYTYKIPYQYQKAFRADQKTAKKNKLGLWGACL